MRRSICMTEPKYVRVGTIGNWKFIYTPANNLPEGSLLKFDPLSKGRDVDWQLPQTNLKTNSNLIWMQMPSGKIVPAKTIEKADSTSLQYEFSLPEEVKTGDSVIIYVGTQDIENLAKKGNKPQEYSQRRRPFNLYIDTKGKGQYREPETFFLDVRGGPLDHLRVLLPSVVSKNQRFDVIIRFEDEFNNLTNLAPEGTLIELSYDQLRENLKWKLFVPETGFITLPNFYFNEPGVYKLKLENLLTKELYFSAPIKCEAGASEMVFWGLLHGESERFDSNENIESCLRYFRDDKAYQFYATSHMESEEETPNHIWKMVSTHIADFNEEDRFTTLLGFMTQGSSGSEGLHQVIYTKDNKPLLRKKDTKYSSVKKIYKSHTTKELIGIPCFTMAKGHSFDFKNFMPEYERVIEIYNAWGSSECLEKEGNLRPIKSKGKIQEVAEGSLRAALNQNHRFGFVAGGLDDRGIFEGLFSSDQAQYSPGLTAIFSAGHSRDALMQALYNRRCYATTGARIIVSLEIGGKPMGSEISTKAKPGLLFNRYINGYVAGTDELKEVQFFRNGTLFHTLKPQGAYFEFAFDDTDPLEKVLLDSPDDRPAFVYYYARVLQKDGHIAWTSPIWIDYESPQKTAPINRKKK